MDGYKTEYISRNGFVSDDAWNKFLKFRAYKKSKLVVAHNKNLRNKKNIKNLRLLIADLKRRKEFDTAEYLKV